jgi:hypothetical protein
VRPDNSQALETGVLRALLPALLNHSRSGAAEVNALIIDHPQTNSSLLNSALGFDLDALKTQLIRGLESVGVLTPAISLFRIELAGSEFRVITVHANLARTLQHQITPWRRELEEKYQVNIRFTEYREPPRPIVPASESEVDPVRLEALRNTYEATRSRQSRTEEFSIHALDWTDRPFISIDSANTKRPEDMFNIRRRANGNLLLEVAIPALEYGDSFFVPYRDTSCIGISHEFDGSGTLISRRIAHVVAHNTCSLDSQTVSCVPGVVPGSGRSLLAQRVEMVRSNPEIMEQIENVYRIGGYLCQQRGPSETTSINFDLSNNATLAEQPSFSVDYLISRIAKLTQHAVGDWLLQHPELPSFVVLRTDLSGSRIFHNIQAIMPDVHHDDLLATNSRERIAEQLRRTGYEAEYRALVENLDPSRAPRSLRIISGPSQIFPEDRIKIKCVRSAIGSVNNNQITRLLSGKQPFDYLVFAEAVSRIEKLTTDQHRRN